MTARMQSVEVIFHLIRYFRSPRYGESEEKTFNVSAVGMKIYNLIVKKDTECVEINRI